MTIETMPPNGAEVPGLWADFFAKLDLHIGSTTKLMRQIERNAKRPPMQPVFGRTAASGIFATGQALVLLPAQAGPDQGHFWYVRSIVVGGLDPTLAVTGRADVYVSASNRAASLAAIGMGDWRDWANFASGVAQVAFYGRGELPLRLNEHLFLVVTGGTNGQQYTAAVQYEDYEESATTQAWDI